MRSESVALSLGMRVPSARTMYVLWSANAAMQTQALRSVTPKTDVKVIRMVRPFVFNPYHGNLWSGATDETTARLAESPANQTPNRRYERHLAGILPPPQDTEQPPLVSQADEPRKSNRAAHRAQIHRAQDVGTGRNRGNPNPRKSGPAHLAGIEI